MEIYNLGMTGNAIKTLLQTVDTRWSVWDAAVEGVQNSVQWTAPESGEKYGPGQRLQACINIHALSYATIASLADTQRRNIRKTAHLVGFDASQELSSTDKSNARNNIEAVWTGDYNKLFLIGEITTTHTTYTGANITRSLQFLEGTNITTATLVSTCGSNAYMALNLAYPNYMDPGFEDTKDMPIAPYVDAYGAVVLGGGKATGKYALAVGGGNGPLTSTGWTNFPVTVLAAGKYSQAFGTHAMTSIGATGGFAQGSVVEARAAYSFARGNHVLTKGTYSAGDGYYVTTSGLYQHVRGFGNYPLGNGWIDIVGYTTSSISAMQPETTTNRRNIYTLSTSGNLHIGGNLYVNDTTSACTNSGSLVATQTWVTSKNYVDSTTLSSQLENYYTKDNIDTTLTSYILSGTLGTKVQEVTGIATFLGNVVGTVAPYVRIVGRNFQTSNAVGAGSIILGYTGLSLSTSMTVGTLDSQVGSFAYTYSTGFDGRVNGAGSVAMGLKPVKVAVSNSNAYFGCTIGYYPIADNYQCVLGRMNMPMIGPSSSADTTPTHTIFVIGNGTNVSNARANAMTIRANGVATFADELYVGATNAACTSNAAFRVPKIYTITSTTDTGRDGMQKGDFGFIDTVPYIYTGTTWIGI